MVSLRQGVLLSAAFIFSIGSVGCCHDPFNVTVSLHDSLRDARGVLPAVEVDMVIVNNADLPAWEQKSMTEYFSPGDPMRASADKYVFRLGEDHKSETLLADPEPGKKPGDPEPGKKLWADFVKTHTGNLLILSSYPSPQPDLPGDQDLRRRTLPLECDRWDHGQKDLKFVVKSSGLTVLTPPNPPK